MNEVNFYKVGGCVRDEILGLKSKDIDFAVEAANYDAMKAAIQERGGEIFLETPQHFTIRAKVPNLGAADFVLARKDGAYSDGRRPDSVEAGTLLDDLARRDFTMNAIAQNEKGELIDPFGGQDALRRRSIEVVGSVDRLREDSLRMLRAIRFAVTKDFFLSPEIESFLQDSENAALLNNVSTERIREEMNKAFAANTLLTLWFLERFPNIRGFVFSRGLSLEATLKQR
jgi:tRNA nucleotidyltransferase (CCA-adding enzyme)